MTDILAVYKNGVFKPTGDVGLNDRHEVRPRTYPLPLKVRQQDLQQTFGRINVTNAAIAAGNGGPSPDGAPDAAADRVRGVGDDPVPDPVIDMTLSSTGRRPLTA